MYGPERIVFKNNNIRIASWKFILKANCHQQFYNDINFACIEDQLILISDIWKILTSTRELRVKLIDLFKAALFSEFGTDDSFESFKQRITIKFEDELEFFIIQDNLTMQRSALCTTTYGFYTQYKNIYKSFYLHSNK